MHASSYTTIWIDASKATTHCVGSFSSSTSMSFSIVVVDFLAFWRETLEGVRIDANVVTLVEGALQEDAEPRFNVIFSNGTRNVRGFREHTLLEVHVDGDVVVDNSRETLHRLLHVDGHVHYLALYPELFAAVREASDRHERNARCDQTFLDDV